MRLHRAVLVLMLASSVATDASAQSAGESIVKLPSDIVWKAPPVSPGPETVVIYGDASKPGVYVTRMRFPAGLKIMPHWHPDEWRTVVVLSGTNYFGLGEQWDESKLRAYPAGTFFSEPKNTPHFVWARDGEVIIQITAMGPTGTTRVPQK